MSANEYNEFPDRLKDLQRTLERVDQEQSQWLAKFSEFNEATDVIRKEEILGELLGISEEIFGPFQHMVTIRHAMGGILDNLKKFPHYPCD